MEYRVLGKSVLKKDAAEKATGRAKFGGDFLFPDLLTGKVLRSPIAHGRIVKIDTRRALALPGVKAVVTHEDTPHQLVGRWVKDRTILAWEQVRFIGDPVAAVAAVDEETAEEALQLISVEYEELPAVFDIADAEGPGAPLVHERLAKYECESAHFHPKGNLLAETHLTLGDVENAWAHCDAVWEDTYRTPVVHQGFIQPHEVTAASDASGRITVWTSSKAPFIVRQAVSQGLNIPMSRLRVIAAAVGGDYGGKGTAQIEPLCVLLAMKSGKPVRLALTREEELSFTFMREATITRLKIGARQDGALLALQGQITYDTGAYCDLVGHLDMSCVLLHGPYRIPHVDITARRVYTNNSPRGHMRAPPAPQPVFALESHLDMVARKLNMDPIEFRLKNAYDEGDRMPTGARVANPGIKETLKRTQEFLREQQKKALEPNTGWGVAACQWGGVPITASGASRDRRSAVSSAWVKINDDGSIVLLTGATESGGGPLTILCQIVAEVLGVGYDDVSVIASDTDGTPYEIGTGGSRTTVRVGNSVRQAAEDARRQLFDLAASKLKVTVGDLVTVGGRVYERGHSDKGLSLAELASLAINERGAPILGTGAELRRAEVQAGKDEENWLDAPMHGAHAVRVQVDPDTGMVTVKDYFACHDVGFAIHPQNVEGQIQGAVATGLGCALYEEVITDKGRSLNPNLSDYRLPTTSDVMPVQMEIVEIPSRTGPFGAKGIGEPPIIPVAPAIANAIYDATGVRLTQLPMTAERVYMGMKGKKG
ncbi:MAG: molybdopterin-dependent oxidoreductase [Chloroflexi bacterium]|nr:molybdopterin-dependent oxidoreductase [Chloroflexota bacterium]